MAQLVLTVNDKIANDGSSRKVSVEGDSRIADNLLYIARELGYTKYRSAREIKIQHNAADVQEALTFAEEGIHDGMAIDLLERQ